MDVFGFALTTFVRGVLFFVFVIIMAFTACFIVLTIWRLLYPLIRPIYNKWCDWTSDCID